MKYRHLRLAWLGSLLVTSLPGCALDTTRDDGPLRKVAEPLSVDRPGDYLVSIDEDLQSPRGALVRIQADGRRVVLSNFADRAQGPVGEDPSQLGLDADGKILLLDRSAGKRGAPLLFRIHPESGRRTVLTDFGDARQGPRAGRVDAFALDAFGQISAVASRGTGPATLVFAIEPRTGFRRVVSDFEDASKGPLGVSLAGIGVIPGDPLHLLVTDREYGVSGAGALFRVQRLTGQRTLVSDFGDASQGPVAVNPGVFAFEPNSHRVFVLDDNAAAGAVLRVEVLTGRRTQVTTFADTDDGPLPDGVTGLSVDHDGSLLAATRAGTAGAVYRIHPASGLRTLIADLGDSTQGLVGGKPAAVAGAFARSAELRAPGAPTPFRAFAFTSNTSQSGAYPDGDVRLDSLLVGERSLARSDLQLVHSATILIDDGVDVERGGHNFASGQGISSALESWETEGPATITPTSTDLAQSLANFNLSSIVVTREAVGTASLEVSFAKPSDTFFFWERGSLASPTTANSDLLVEALGASGRVLGAYKLLRSEYSPTGIEITTWNGSFYSPSTPTGAKPQLGAVGLELAFSVRKLRLTSVQEAVGGLRDDGPDYKVIAAAPRHR